jgi:penicillin V acylase-like amidase (Ntn superfamily)
MHVFSEDIINEKGLYIEANMRPNQPESTGISPSYGTNPNAKVSLSFAALIRYLKKRCANVTEVINLVNTLNVYGMIKDEFAWAGGYFLADETVHYGILELIDNKLIWADDANFQTNYYINKEYKDEATNGIGLGRFSRSFNT